ncbi:raftlin isoform X3 [Tupaia chinensis]|uniref:raftlin isoform X3 n=1 Tax=Tupaia chinensis TaxID=246437 RepID=UPI000FFB31F7|nr:raftlin isoform X3 [Tupaia chinensis]
MGCGLNKLEKRSEKRPGNIYSTLKRPQVETKVDVAYEYRFLDFTTLSTAELPRSSAVRLSSLRDLPAQLLELYQQGFSLAALHPFVQPTHEWEKTPLQHIFRAILIKKTDRSQKTDVPNDGYVLELDCCSSLDHLTDQKIIPEFIKKVQEAASQGLKFVGVIPQYHSPPGSPASCEADARGGRGTQEGPRSLENEDLGAPDTCDAPAERHQSPGPGGEAPVAEQPSLPSGEGDGGEFSPGRGSTTLDVPDGTPAAVRGQPLPGKMEILALFNKPKSHQKYRQYYPVTIPLRISKNGQTVSGLDANWLEHMSDHFRKGGMLVNAVFYLGMVNDSLHGLTDGVFIFEAISTEDEKTIQGYDAIVVEQWTVLDFQWRFSREEVRSRRARKSKGQLGARDARAEDADKSAEEPSRAVGSGELGALQGDSGSEVRGPDPEGEQEAGAVQNGPAGHSRAPGGCARHPDPAEDAAEGGDEEPSTAGN